ncbi:MAG: PilZ domain-containing protein, partial [Bdellovibrionota bacterium]
TRYQIDSAVTLKLGDRELVGQVSTISMGGVQLNTDAWLENGGIVKMSICSPDGKEQIEVEGRVVWSEEKKRYGVAFENTAEGVRSAISNWTSNLLKAN